MKVVEAIETMRKIVDAYDKFEAKKLKIKNKAKALKGGNYMKFGTVIGIVVGAITLIAAGAAAMYFYLKKDECCCCKDCCDCDDDFLFDDFPEEEDIAFDEPVEAPTEEIAE